MKTQTQLKTVACLAGIGSTLLLSSSAMGQVLYSDSFTAADGTMGVGRTPDGTVASAFVGNTYSQQGYDYSGYGGTGINEAVYSNAQDLRGDFGLKLAFGSVAGFSGLGATQFQISDTFSVNNLNADSFAGHGVGLGFYSTDNTGNGWGNFYGLTVNANGNMALMNNGTAWASATISGFNAATAYALSYKIDTTSGAISDILLNGNSVALDFGANANNLFTGSAINNVGFYGSQPWNWPSVEYGTVDNFQVSVAAVPEPATSALAAIGLGLLIVTRRKRS